MDTVVLDGNSLTIAQVVAVARHRARVSVSDAARSRMARSNAAVNRVVENNEVVYGVTTGFGKLSEMAIPHERLAELQVNLIRSHAVGVGPLLSEEEVRAMMLLRANVISKGYSGARASLVDLLAGMLNAGLFPPVPEQGSVGASGDLAPLAHLALSMIGEGILMKEGTSGPAEEMLLANGLQPVALGPKEGITLINGTQAHTAIAALLVHDTMRLWRAAHVAAAMSLEALKGTPVAFDARIQEARGQLGQIESARVMRALLVNSEIRESHVANDRRVQDAYGLRCVPQVHGPVLDALTWIEGVVTRELNAATDNPLVFDNDEMLSGGNFHGQAVAMALDFLAIAATNLAVISERRIDRLVHPDLNEGLPAFLSPDAGTNSGFMMAQVTAASITSECKVLAHPSSVDSIPTDGSKEDVVPMAMGAAWKARRIVTNVRNVLAVELMCAAQGIDFRAPLAPAIAVGEAQRRVRAVVPRLVRDRVMSGDIERIAAEIFSGRFDDCVSVGETA
ncbi:MAG: histidine ammonia-lyase [Gemmatimonadota bacterium]|nr:histidine ammonia-lyase [Gemmatimonadota bacterium]